jgi:pyruvate dehydrogenase E2 component (dihydrolipoamide acetyltransferase)
MPSVAPNMAEGKLVSWLVNVGELAQRGEPLLEVETDKATVEVEASATGTLRRRLARTGMVVPVGALIGIITTGEAGDAEVNTFIQNFGR